MYLGVIRPCGSFSQAQIGYTWAARGDKGCLGYSLWHLGRILTIVLVRHKSLLFLTCVLLISWFISPVGPESCKSYSGASLLKLARISYLKLFFLIVLHLNHAFFPFLCSLRDLVKCLLPWLLLLLPTNFLRIFLVSLTSVVFLPWV